MAEAQKANVEAVATEATGSEKQSAPVAETDESSTGRVKRSTLSDEQKSAVESFCRRELRKPLLASIAWNFDAIRFSPNFWGPLL